jgi:hypothetical protein
VAEWKAYEMIRGPVGPQRDDFLNAKSIREQWCMAIPQKAEEIRPADFLMFEEPPKAEPKRQSPELQMAVARGISAIIAAKGG